MSAQHTPGPWKALAIDSAGWVDIVQQDTDEVWPLPFAACKHFDQEANARLIAAAPELLAALQGMDEAYCRAGMQLTRAERNEDRQRLIAARDAIAKATGQKGGA